MSSPDKSDIGYRFDHYLRVRDGQFLNIDAICRKDPCPTCKVEVGRPCVVSRGPRKGEPARFGHVRRGFEHLKAHPAYHTAKWEYGVRPRSIVQRLLQQEGKDHTAVIQTSPEGV